MLPSFYAITLLIAYVWPNGCIESLFAKVNVRHHLFFLLKLMLGITFHIGVAIRVHRAGSCRVG